MPHEWRVDRSGFTSMGGEKYTIFKCVKCDTHLSSFDPNGPPSSYESEVWMPKEGHDKFVLQRVTCEERTIEVVQRE